MTCVASPKTTGTRSGYVAYRCRCDACTHADRAYKQAYRADNREKIAVKDKAWREANLVRARAKTAAHRAANPDLYREYARNHYDENREAYIARARAHSRSPHGRRWHHINRELRRGVPFTPQATAYLSILAADPCAYCGGASTAIDHIDPVSRGGSSDWDNLTAACGSCNSQKNAKPLLRFLATR